MWEFLNQYGWYFFLFGMMFLCIGGVWAAVEDISMTKRMFKINMKLKI